MKIKYKLTKTVKNFWRFFCALKRQKGAVMEAVYLVMVDSVSNHNKFYRMVPHGSTWTAEYGRVGATGAKCDYPMSQWDAKLQEKINKGYTDQTALHQAVVTTVT